MTNRCLLQGTSKQPLLQITSYNLFRDSCRLHLHSAFSGVQEVYETNCENLTNSCDGCTNPLIS